MKVLIVEDDFVARRVLQRLISAYGEAEIAVSGEEAVAAHYASLDEGEPYDLIFLDIMLPGIDGHEVLSRIRAHDEGAGKERVRIIMTSSLRDAKNVMGAFKAQADAYLTKPFSSAGLTQALVKAEVDLNGAAA